MNELPLYRTWIVHKNGRVTLMPEHRPGRRSEYVLLQPGYVPFYDVGLPMSDDVFTVATPVEPDVSLTEEDRALLLRIGHVLGVYPPTARTPANALQLLDTMTLYERPEGRGSWRVRRGDDQWVVVRRPKRRRPLPGYHRDHSHKRA